MSDYPMLISNKLHSFRNFCAQNYELYWLRRYVGCKYVVFAFAAYQVLMLIL